MLLLRDVDWASHLVSARRASTIVGYQAGYAQTCCWRSGGGCGNQHVRHSQTPVNAGQACL
eukprot:835460-Amphidinium_carterae.1